MDREKLLKNKGLSMALVLMLVFPSVLSMGLVTQAAEEEFTVIVEASSQYYVGEVATITVQTLHLGKITPVDRIEGVIVRPDGVEDHLILTLTKAGFGNIYRATYSIPYLEGDYLIVVTISWQGIKDYGVKTFRAIKVFGPASGIVEAIEHMHGDVHGIVNAMSTVLIGVWVIVALLAVAIVLLAMSWRRLAKPSE